MPTAHSSRPLSCTIFCHVIDNYGDMGVCWRLARQLQSELGWRVSLVLDDLPGFKQLCPGLDPSLDQQSVESVQVIRWPGTVHGLADPMAPDAPDRSDAIETLAARESQLDLPPVPQVVIEAFACELPPNYLAAMSVTVPRPIYINLDYLSGEDWVAEYHLGQSPHPRLDLVKTFFFPGLGPGTGGVLKEPDLDRQYQRFRNSAAERADLWASLELTEPPLRSTVISMFSYENPALEGLLAQWRDGATQTVLLVPAGRISPQVARFFGVADFSVGASAKSGNLLAHSLPFTDQPAYDRLLWTCDVNFVRGEDSFVRAQWARQPFAWHIYPQADAAHLPKLDAALNHYSRGLPVAARTALERFWHAWNGVGKIDWNDFWQHREPLRQRAMEWADELAGIGDLAGNLAKYCETRLK